MPPPYETILFDFDHTLIDSDASEDAALDVTLREVGVDDPTVHRNAYRNINRRLWSRVEGGELEPNEVKTRRFSELISEIDIDADPVAMGDTFVEGLASHGDLYPGVREMLDVLAGVATLAMVTNGIGMVQRTRIARLGLADHFSAVSISGELGTAKPGSAIFDHTFSALGHPDPGRAVMVGDSLTSDIRGGRDFGIATCWYNTTRQRPPADASITHEVQSIDALTFLVAG